MNIFVRVKNEFLNKSYVDGIKNIQGELCKEVKVLIFIYMLVMYFFLFCVLIFYFIFNIVMYLFEFFLKVDLQ